MIDETECLARATKLVDRARRDGYPVESARRLALADVRVALASEIDEVLENVASVLEQGP